MTEAELEYRGKDRSWRSAGGPATYEPSPHVSGVSGHRLLIPKPISSDSFNEQAPAGDCQRPQGKWRDGGVLGPGGPRPFSVVNEPAPRLPGTEAPGRETEQLQLDYRLDYVDAAAGVSVDPPGSGAGGTGACLRSSPAP